MRKDSAAERWWDWPAAILLVLAFYFGAARLQTTNWTEYLGRIQILVLIAAGLGLSLGYTRFRPWISFLFGAVFTLAIPGWVLAALIRADTWLERAVSLLGRLVSASADLVGNQAVRDPILFLTAMMLLYWIATFNAAYHLVRKGKPWVGLAVMGVVVLIVEYSYDMYAVADPGTLYSIIFFLSVVLLVARVYFLNSRRDWQNRGYMVENEVGFDLGRGAAAAGLVLVVLAWYSPRIVRTLTPGSTENLQLTAEIQRFRERFDKAVSSLRSQSPITVQSLGGTLGLGRGTNLSEDLVFYAKPASGRLNASRYYWSGRFYETYNNDQWESEEEVLTKMGPPTGPLSYELAGRTEVNVDFSSRISFLRTLYFPGAVMDISRPVSAVALRSGDTGVDLTAMIMDPPLRSGETYQVKALVSTPTIKQLRESALDEVPPAIIEKYLQLPENFSPRIRALAEDITEGLETPYDKSQAITQYLRENITYEPALPDVPVDVDPIEWFLFTRKAGFCNYYASAQVLMLRSLGVPSRLAVGYAEGTWNDTDKRYEVRSKDYHAWPEVYFPGLGWVPFEPTGGQPVLVYPEGTVVESSSAPVPTPFATPLIPDGGAGRELEDDLDTTSVAARRQQETIARLGIAGAGAAAAGLLIFGLYRLFEKPIRARIPLAVVVEQTLEARGWRVPNWLRRWARAARRTPMEKLFASVSELLRAWGNPAQPNLTPAEQVERLAGLVPEVRVDASTLLDEYQRSIYSPYAADFNRARRAAEDMRANGYRAWINRRGQRRM